jgi:hypothetical protein
MNLTRIAFAALATVLFLGAGERAAYADFCLQDDNTFVPTQYQLQIGTAAPNVGTPIVVTGVRVVALLHRHPVTGTLQSNPLGGLLMSLQTVVDFGTGSWTHPFFTTLVRFGATTITYDTTGFGNGAPSNSKGQLHTINCPLAAAPASAEGGN